ncbi:ABC transporter permease [Erythrobacter sp. HKB08]|uniref:cell division protein FtsX n=1 Tax=Erythrobacter sp. HKB08 TaxID=2502843 RepID=UPI0018F899EE|nr:cell division protein [Erythrobacter sp. HKB08]
MKKPPTVGRSIVRGFSRFGGQRAAQLVPQARLAGPMPWVIAIMVALVVVAAAGGLALSNIAGTARAELAGGATVQILEASPELRERQAAIAIASLEADPAVASTRRVPDEELDALLEPWLGVGVDNETVPVPALIDVRLAGPATQDVLDRLQRDLAERAPDARIDAQASWLGPVFDAIASLQYLALALVVLLALTSVAAVWLAARSALGGNFPTIEVVHMLGGTDAQIARIFERSIGFDATLGGAVGLAAGAGAVLLLGRQFDALGSGMMAGGALGMVDWAIIIAIPFAAIAIAMITARLTVLLALRRIL